MEAPRRLVLDANVLFSAALRDTFLRAAKVGLCQIFWSEQILDEMCRSLIVERKSTAKKAARLRANMEESFPEAMVSGHQDLAGEMDNESGDRHVAAAAVKAKAGIVVTSNLRDFKNLPIGIQAVSPDEFLVGLFDQESDAMVGILVEQAAFLKAPPQSLDELLVGLQKVAPRFVEKIRSHSSYSA